MASPHLPTESRASEFGLESFLPVRGEQWRQLADRDEALMAELAAAVRQDRRFYAEDVGLFVASSELANLMSVEYEFGDLAKLEDYLHERGTLTIPTVDGYTVRVDGVRRDVRLVPATELSTDGASHGDMSSMLYLRDQIQAASALIELSLADSDRYAEEGKTGRDLLLSALHLMSTEAQLERFESVIRLGAGAGQADWPQISLHFDDLEGRNPNGWRNKQDTLQMLAYATFDAIERGVLDVAELAEGHKQFLQSIVPLLESVGFPRYENSGSWEEVAAVRTSVMAIEAALLSKIRGAVDDERFAFLVRGEDFVGRVDDMIEAGLVALGQRLPFESPEYDTDSVKYREADAALVYVLGYDLPRMLAEREIPMAANGGRPMREVEIEDMILAQLFSLVDDETHGMFRYDEDSYQRVNFHTNTVQMVVGAIKRKLQHDAAAIGIELDLDEKQRLRGLLTPAGKPAAWTHPLGQLSSWAAKRSAVVDRADSGRYRQLSTHFLNTALSVITGEGQQNAVLDESGRYRLKSVPAYKLPECYVTYRLASGEAFSVPSPHTPLNWSTAMLKEAIGLMHVDLVTSE